MSVRGHVVSYREKQIVRFVANLGNVKIRLFALEIQWCPNALLCYFVTEGDFDLTMRRYAIQGRNDGILRRAILRPHDNTISQ